MRRDVQNVELFAIGEWPLCNSSLEMNLFTRTEVISGFMIMTPSKDKNTMLEKKKPGRPKKTETTKKRTPVDPMLVELKEIRKLLGELKDIADSIWRERKP